MGSDLHHTIPKFFESRMSEHSAVRAIRKIEVAGEFVYEIERLKFGDSVRVWLSDAYLFTEMDFHNRPKELRKGDYILIAKPEGGGDVSRELKRSTGIGVGKLAELMGALNLREMWGYVPPTEEQKRDRLRKFGKRKYQ